ncbi:hypothetical protein [Parabacteroides pacaensis]|uniref:hypothetical protein n=1 Tax=Parabacteroides pacaensis TaxID=2086575 RepID=UPI000D113D9A|nr:hypothetical protein [Parabacteroides pacaensis]
MLRHQSVVFQLKGEKEAAYQKLNEAFLNEVALASLSGWNENKEDDYQERYKQILVKYTPLFDVIGLGHPEYTLYDTLEKVKTLSQKNDKNNL